MIHAATLPEITRQRLSEIVSIQFAMLDYAATEQTPSISGCESWLAAKPTFRSRVGVLSNWIWGARSRHEPLEAIAEGPSEAKATIVSRWKRDAKMFKDSPSGTLIPVDFSHSQNWEKAGAAFLVRFYEDFRSKAGFPAKLFQDSSIGGFSGQDFLQAFLLGNGRLCVCPACEETGYLTISRSAIRSEIDHYFPKSLYPHLSCHAYNLIPLCHGCNSWVKGDRDPLARKDGTRRRLEDIWLPYREEGLSRCTYLEVEIPSAGKAARFGKIKPLTGHVIRERTEALGDIYELPGRWGGRVDEIGEKLFRRMRDYVRHRPELATGINSSQLSDGFDELITTLYDEDLGREPFVFPMIWWLAKLVNEEIAFAPKETSTLSPLMEEIASWLPAHDTHRGELRTFGQQLRKELQAESAATGGNWVSPGPGGGRTPLRRKIIL